jgi:hypothetical protein
MIDLTFKILMVTLCTTKIFCMVLNCIYVSVWTSEQTATFNLYITKILVSYDMIYIYIYIYIYIHIFNRSWVDTRWQQFITHLHTNSTHNTEIGKKYIEGKIGKCRPCPVLRIIPWHLPYN